MDRAPKYACFAGYNIYSGRKKRETRQKSVSLPPKAGELASLQHGTGGFHYLEILGLVQSRRDEEMCVRM